MFRTTTRQLLLRSGRRSYASTPASTDAAKETAQKAMAKAEDALKRASAAAGPMVAKVSSGAAAVASRIPGGGEKAVGRIQAIIPPTIYYSKVAGHLAKLVFEGQQMGPPSWARFKQFWEPVYKPLLSPSTYAQTLKELPSKLPPMPNPRNLLTTLQEMPRKTYAEYGVLGAELLGFFTVGEMIGRWKIVGYRGGAPKHHH